MKFFFKILINSYVIENFSFYPKFVINNLKFQNLTMLKTTGLCFFKMNLSCYKILTRHKFSRAETLFRIFPFILLNGNMWQFFYINNTLVNDVCAKFDQSVEGRIYQTISTIFHKKHDVATKPATCLLTNKYLLSIKLCHFVIHKTFYDFFFFLIMLNTFHWNYYYFFFKFTTHFFYYEPFLNYYYFFNQFFFYINNR